MYFNKLPIWIKVLIGLLGFIVIAALTAGILYIISPSSKSSVANGSSSSARPTIANAQALIDAYKSSSIIKDRNNYTLLSVNPTDTYIQYASNKRPYGVTITAASYVQYQMNNTNVTANSSSLINTTELFLNGFGITKNSEQVTGSFTSRLFEGSTVACQTDDRQAIGKQPASYGLVCVDTATIDRTYKQLDSLSGLTGGALVPGAINSVTMTDIADGSKQLTVLITSNKDKSSTTYYFISPDQQTWQYVGSRPTPSVDIQDSFAIPTKLQTAINSSPYKDFLNQYIK